MLQWPEELRTPTVALNWFNPHTPGLLFNSWQVEIARGLGYVICCYRPYGADCSKACTHVHCGGAGPGAKHWHGCILLLCIVCNKLRISPEFTDCAQGFVLPTQTVPLAHSIHDHAHGLHSTCTRPAQKSAWTREEGVEFAIYQPSHTWCTQKAWIDRRRRHHSGLKQSCSCHVYQGRHVHRFLCSTHSKGSHRLLRFIEVGC
jgi:hypothetical protein